jgi:hypothetical protein
MTNLKRICNEVIEAREKAKEPCRCKLPSIPGLPALPCNAEVAENKFIQISANHADKLARVLLVMEEALKRNERILDSMKSELCASVYTVTDDEFDKVYACRDFSTEALAQAEEILK